MKSTNRIEQILRDLFNELEYYEIQAGVSIPIKEYIRIRDKYIIISQRFNIFD